MKREQKGTEDRAGEGRYIEGRAGRGVKRGERAGA